jgi:hypothetical protein
VVGITDRQDRDTRVASLFYQKWPSCSQGRLRKTIGRIDPDKPRSHILDHRNSLAVDPAAIERRDITRHTEYTVTVGAVALGTGAVLRQHPCDVDRSAVSQEYLLKQCRQLIE